MNLLSRVSLYALAIALLFALTTSPVSLSPCPGTSIGPTPAWAGGSPDETLNPPSTPPKSSYSPGVYGTVSTGSTSTLSVSRKPVFMETRWVNRMALVWRFYLTSVLRF